MDQGGNCVGFCCGRAHHLLTCVVPYATSVHRRFSVGQDGKRELSQESAKMASSSLAQLGERMWWLPLQPSNRRLGHV